MLAAQKRADAGRIRGLLRTWVGTGALDEERRAINGKGKTAPFVVVGRWAEF